MVQDVQSIDSDVLRERSLVRRIDRLIVPYAMVLYTISFLDRVNIGNAHKDLMEDLDMNEEQYSIAVGVFFIGDILFKVPSNLVVKRATPPRWIGFIMIVWGAVSTCMGLVQNFAGLVACRVLLGIFEAGFLPGMVYYFTFWYKGQEIGSRIAFLFSSAAIAGCIGGVLAYGILQMNGVAGLEGWRWLFIIEGLPSVILGAITWFYLPHLPDPTKPSRWFTQEQLRFAQDRLRNDPSSNVGPSKFDAKQFTSTLRNHRVWTFAFCYFALSTPLYCISFFLPAIINSFGFDILTSNAMTTPLYGLAVVLTVLNAWHSDLTNERAWHLGVFALVGAFGFTGLGIVQVVANLDEEWTKWVSYAFSGFACVGVFPAIAVTLAWLSNSVSGATASGVATGLVMSCGNVGGIVGPQIYAGIEMNLGSYSYAHLVVAAMMLMAFASSMVMRYIYSMGGGAQTQGKFDLGSQSDGQTEQAWLLDPRHP